MNGARRWKEFVSWWDGRFPAQSGINKKYTASQVINEIEDKIFELRNNAKKEDKANDPESV